MRTIEGSGVITPDGQLAVRVPADIAPGEHRVVVVIDEQPLAPAEQEPDDFAVFDVGAWPPSLLLSRADLYGDDGR